MDLNYSFNFNLIQIFFVYFTILLFSFCFNLFLLFFRSNRRRIHKFRTPEELDKCPLLSGVTFIVTDPIQPEVARNRVLFLTSAEEQVQQSKSGDPCSTVTAVYSPGDHSLSFSFWMSYDNIKLGFCYDRAYIGIKPLVSVVPFVVPVVQSPSLLVPVLPSMPFVVTVSKAAPIPSKVPIHFVESFWNQLAASATAIGLDKLDLELIAIRAKAKGINIEAVNEILSNALYNWKVSRSLKRKFDQVNNGNDSDYEG
jgi:hypothetical protein